MAVEDDLVRRLARSSGLRSTTVRRFLQMDLVVSDHVPIEPILVQRLRRVRRMRRDLGLSMDAIVIILRLLDRIEMLEGTSGPAGTARPVSSLDGPPRGSGPTVEPR